MNKVIAAFLVLLFPGLSGEAAWANDDNIEIQQMPANAAPNGSDQEQALLPGSRHQADKDYQSEVLSNPLINAGARAKAVDTPAGGNMATIIQNGSANKSAIAQKGSGNHATQIQTGHDNDLRVEQNGDRNSSVEQQTGAYNHKTEIQNGNKTESVIIDQPTQPQ